MSEAESDSMGMVKCVMSAQKHLIRSCLKTCIPTSSRAISFKCQCFIQAYYQVKIALHEQQTSFQTQKVSAVKLKNLTAKCRA